jgi:HAE1 family hydrophobic/amphiphilic exporter-1
MILSEVSIRRPVFAAMMTLALLVLGITSYFALSVDLFPEIDFPFVIVSVTYPGASAESVETDISKKVEDACNTIAGVDHIESTAYEGYSLTMIQFTLETDGLDAAAEVRDKVSTIRGELPEDIEEPVIQRFDPESQPIISLAVSGPQSTRDLTDYVDDIIRPRLENISGVGAANIIGPAEREIQVRLDPERLNAFEIAPSMVAAKLQAANVEFPGGKVSTGGREWVLRTMGRFETIQQIRDMVVFTPKGRLVRLSEIAEVIDTEKEPTSVSRLNGHPAVGLDIRRQSGANTVKVANEVKEELERIRTDLPAGMDIAVANDQSIFIRDAIEDVLINIAYGGTLAIIVIFLFLANLRTTIISGIAIPTSIIATFTLMRILGFTINFMTLLGLSLAVGLLIDDAIVVIENIYRHLQMGKKPMQAAREATNEIGLAVSATAFSIIVVFLPVAFMEGIVGQFFYSFGMTVAFAIAISLFVAFTLTPMLSSRFLDAGTDKPKNAFYKRISRWGDFFAYVERTLYRPALRWALSHRFITMFLATVAFVGSLFLGSLIGSEFVPQTDQSMLFIFFEGRAGNSLNRTIEQIEPVEQIILGHPEVISILTTIGSGANPVYKGSMTVKMTEISEREISSDSLSKLLREELKAVPGLFYTVNLEGDEHSVPISISVRGQDLAQLDIYANELMDSIRHVPGVVDLQSSQEAGKPELRVNLNRDLVSDLGVNVADVAMTLRTLVDGQVVSRFKEGDDEYDIRLQVAERYRQDPSSLSLMTVPSNKDITGRDRFVVPLDRIGSIGLGSSPAEIKRFDRMREVRISGGVVDRSTGEVRADIQTVMDSLNLPQGYSMGHVGEAEWMEESFREILMALVLAVIFIYLVLASQYNSFVDPLSIMMSQPLAIVGAMVSLLIFGSNFSIISLIGIVMLMGLVTKNAILLVDFAKQRRAGGMERNQALREAGSIRFRPILMTALSTIFGVLPLALGLGPGAELRAPIARAVMGGMISSTVLTLLVIPVVYTYFDDLAHGNFRAIFGLKPKQKQPVAVK